jgi:hypothetical protein
MKKKTPLPDTALTGEADGFVKLLRQGEGVIATSEQRGGKLRAAAASRQLMSQTQLAALRIPNAAFRPTISGYSEIGFGRPIR